METNIQIFTSDIFGKIRTCQVNNQIMFVGKDVAQALGYSNTRDALNKHVDAEDKLESQIATSGQRRTTIIINESGLYSLILSSKLPQARAFKRWVTSEVLPSIRKTGRYEGRDLARLRTHVSYSLKGSKTASRSVGMDIDWTPSPLPHEGEEQIAARKEEWLRKVPDLDRAYSIAFPKSTPLNVNKKKRIRERCTC